MAPAARGALFSCTVSRTSKIESDTTALKRTEASDPRAHIANFKLADNTHLFMNDGHLCQIEHEASANTGTITTAGGQ
jgi:hypothetical protein